MSDGKRFPVHSVAAIRVVLAFAALSLMSWLAAGPSPVFAGGGTCPNGGQYSNVPSGGYSPGINPCGSSTQTTQTYMGCPDGTFVLTGQSCPSVATTYTSCPDGTYVAAGSYCPATATQIYTSCPIGGYAVYGSACPGYTTCPNGTWVLAGQYCPNSSSGYVTCPNGTVVTSGGICPSGGLGYCTNPYANPGYCTNTNGGTFSVSYSAGWNIVGGPSGTVISSSPSPLYAYPPGAGSYQTLPPGSALQAGSGYWAYFPTTTTLTLAAGASGSTTINVPPGLPALIGNPGYSTATVSGTGVTLYVWSPTANSYQQTNQLAAGQGGWVMSTTGGSITISSGGVPGSYPPGGPPPPPPF